MHLVGYLMMLALCAATPSISQRKAVLDALRNVKNLNEIVAIYAADERQFSERRAKYLLY